MSAVISVSTGRRSGVARICRSWGLARSGLYRSRVTALASPKPRRRQGPQGPMADAALVEAIRQALIGSPFHGAGYRKVRARLRYAGLRTSKERGRRLMREDGLPAPVRTGRPQVPATTARSSRKRSTRCGMSHRPPSVRGRWRMT